MPSMPSSGLAAAALLLAAAAATAEARPPAPGSCLARGGDHVVLEAAADTTLYSNDYSRSNGEGSFLYAGRLDPHVQRHALRRALLRFPTLGEEHLPAGAVITGAELWLRMSDTVVGDGPVEARRVLGGPPQWGEGASEGDGRGGSFPGNGAHAQPGDATWTARVVPGLNWTTPGGDLAANASAVTTVDSVGDYAWSGPGMVRDVEAWRAGDEPNGGWALLASEDGHSLKRFNSRQSPEAPPRLVVRYRVEEHRCAAAPPAPPAGEYDEGCAGLAGGEACGLSCPDGSTPSDPEGACCSRAGWQVATCERPCGAGQERLVLRAQADATVFAASPDSANGAGPELRAGDGERALLRFDLSGAAAALHHSSSVSVWRAELRAGLVNASAAAAAPLLEAWAVARAAAGSPEWGEGAQEDGGAPGAAAAGDATWRARAFPGELWTEAGGDVASAASAGPAAANASLYTLGGDTDGGAGGGAGAGLAADVRGWLADAHAGEPVSPGWQLRAAGAGAGAAARLASREAPDSDAYARPRLVVCLLDGLCHNGRLDAGEACDPGAVLLDGCDAECRVAPGHGCTTPGAGPTSSCAAADSRGAYSMAVPPATGGDDGQAVTAALHVAGSGGRDTPSFVVEVSALPGSLGDAAGASLVLRGIDAAEAGDVPLPTNRTATGLAFEALADGGGFWSGSAMPAVLPLPSVHCSPRVALYSRQAAGDAWTPAADSCEGGSPQSLEDCVLSVPLCGPGQYAVLTRSVASENDDPGSTSSGGHDRTVFVIVMASLGGVIVLGLAFCAWTWCSTRRARKYKYQEDMPAEDVSNIGRDSLVDF